MDSDLINRIVFEVDLDTPENEAIAESNYLFEKHILPAIDRISAHYRSSNTAVLPNLEIDMGNINEEDLGYIFENRMIYELDKYIIAATPQKQVQYQDEELFLDYLKNPFIPWEVGDNTDFYREDFVSKAIGKASKSDSYIRRLFAIISHNIRICKRFFDVSFEQKRFPEVTAKIFTLIPNQEAIICSDMIGILANKNNINHISFRDLSYYLMSNLLFGNKYDIAKCTVLARLFFWDKSSLQGNHKSLIYPKQHTAIKQTHNLYDPKQINQVIQKNNPLAQEFDFVSKTFEVIWREYLKKSHLNKETSGKNVSTTSTDKVYSTNINTQLPLNHDSISKIRKLIDNFSQNREISDKDIDLAGEAFEAILREYRNKSHLNKEASGKNVSTTSTNEVNPTNIDTQLPLNHDSTHKIRELIDKFSQNREISDKDIDLAGEAFEAIFREYQYPTKQHSFSLNIADTIDDNKKIDIAALPKLGLSTTDNTEHIIKDVDTGQGSFVSEQKEQGLQEKIISDIINQPVFDKHILVYNAGLVLYQPFLISFFDRLGLLENRKIFHSIHHQIRAVHLLQELAAPDSKHYEHLLLFNKILCGINILFPIGEKFTPTHTEKAETERLTKSLIANWDTIRNTSISGFRNSFVNRHGLLEQSQSDYILHVETKGMDILLDDIPWNIRLISFPWNNFIIHVDWKLQKRT